MLDGEGDQGSDGNPGRGRPTIAGVESHAPPVDQSGAIAAYLEPHGPRGLQWQIPEGEIARRLHPEQAMITVLPPENPHPMHMITVITGEGVVTQLRQAPGTGDAGTGAYNPITIIEPCYWEPAIRSAHGGHKTIARH